MEIQDLVEPIEAALRATRPRVQAAFARAPDPERFKEDGTAVTDLDLALEREIAEMLLTLEPAWGLFSEESGWLREGTPAWHVDPLDGTANFSRRIGVFATQLALVEGTEPLFAAVYQPLTDQFTWAGRGLGTWHEGRRVHTGDRTPEHALLCVDISRSGLFVERPELLPTLRGGCYKARALGSVAVHLRDVAVGAADGYLGGRRHVTPLHDVAPGTLLVQEAGGIVSDGEGGNALAERRVLVAASPRAHDWLCGMLATI